MRGIVGAALAQVVKRMLPGIRGRDLRADMGEQLRQGIARFFLIIHQQHPHVFQRVQRLVVAGHSLHGAGPFVFGIHLIAQRQVDRKRRPLVLAIAVRHRAPAMQLGQLADKRQAQTQAFRATGVRRIGLPERVEQEGHEFRRDALALVHHRNAHVDITGFDRHLDVRPLRAELDGVGQQVPDDLLDPLGIAHKPDRRIGKRGRDRHIAFRRGLGRAGNRGVDGRLQRKGLFGHAQAARHDLRCVKQLFDHANLLLHAGLDAGNRAGHRGRPRIDPILKHVGPTLDPVQRRTQFMRHDGQELVARTRGGLGLEARRLLTDQQGVAFKLCFGPLRHVIRDGQHRVDAAITFEFGQDAGGEVPSARLAVVQREVERAFLAALEDFARGLVVGGGYRIGKAHLGNAFADEIASVNAKGIARGAVHIQVPQIAAQAGDDIGRVLDQCLQLTPVPEKLSLFVVGQHRLGRVVDRGDRARKTGDRAALHHGRGPEQYFAAGRSGRGQTYFNVECSAVRRAFGKCRDQRGAAFFRYDIHPPAAGRTHGRLARQAGPRGVDIAPVATHASHPQDTWRLVSQVTEAEIIGV